MVIKRLLSYALIAALIFQPQMGNALAPKSLVGDDKTLKDGQTRYLGALVAEFHAKYAPPRKSKKGKEAPWQSPSQDAIKGLEAAARQLWDDTSLVLSMDAERKAIVFTGESGDIYILSAWEPIVARDEKITGKSLKASAKKIPEKIGPYYARAYESAPDLGERMVSRRAFAKAVAKGGVGMVLAAILGRKAARKVTQWYNRHFGPTAKTGGLYVLFGLHDTIENMKKNFDVLEDEFLPSIPEQDGRPKAIAVLEAGLDVETLFAEFKKKFPKHQDLSIWDIIARKELRGEIKKLYEEEMQKAHARVEAIVPDPARYEKDQMHYYMAARFKSLGMRVVLESTPFEIWFSDIPMHLNHKPAFDKKDFNLFLQLWATRLMALVGERKGRDVALRGLVKQLLDDNPGTSVVAIRGDRHSLNSDVIAVQGRPFQSVLNTDAAIMNNSAYWICKEWAKLERASDDQKRLALHKFIVRMLIESVLMEGGLVDNLGQAIVVTRQAMEKIEKGDTTWENWVRKRFVDSKNEMEMGEWLINDMVGSGTFKLDPNRPQGVHKILFGGTMAVSHPEEKPVPAGEIAAAAIPEAETDRQTIATMAVGQAISRVLRTAPSFDDAQVLKTSFSQELQKLGVTVSRTEGPVLEFSLRVGEEAFPVKMDLTELRAAAWEDSRVPRGKVLAFVAMPVQIGEKTIVFEYRDRDEIPDEIWTNRKVVKAASPSNIIPVDSQENTGMTFYGAPDGFVVPTSEEFSEEIAALEGEISEGDFAKRGLSKTLLVAMLALSSALTACAPPAPARIVMESGPVTMGNITPADTWVIRTNMANDPNLTHAKPLSSPRIEVSTPGIGENAPYRVSVKSSDATSATTLGTFNVFLPMADLTDPQPVRRLEAVSDGSALAAMVRYSKDGHDKNFRVILFGSDQKPMRQFNRPGRSAEDVRQMRVIASPLGALVLLLYADNTLEVLNGRNGAQLSFKIRMPQVGSLLADMARFTLYARAVPEGRPVGDDEILEKIELFPAMLTPGTVAQPGTLPEAGLTPSGPVHPGSRVTSVPTATGTPPSSVTTSAPVTTVDTSPTSTVPLADGGRVDFEERSIAGATILCAVVRHNDGSEKFAPIPIRFGEGPVHAELLVRDPRSLVIVRGMERQVLDLTNGGIFVRTENIKLAGQIRSGVWPSDTRFYQTERYVVTEDVREGDPEKKLVEKFWLRDLRTDGNRQVFRVNEFLDQQLYEGRVLDLGASFYGYASIFYGNYQVKAFPVSTPDWGQSLQVIQLYTLDGQFVDQVVLHDDSGESSGILLWPLNKDQFSQPDRERPDILHFQPYTLKVVSGPLSTDALGFDLSKFFTRTLKDLFPGRPGLEPPGVLQSIPITAGTVELERGMNGNLQIGFRKPSSRDPLFQPLPIQFGDGEIRLAPIEGQEFFFQIIRGNERQIVDTLTGKIFVSSGDFALYGTPLYTVSESLDEDMPTGEWLIRSSWWKNEPKAFSVHSKQERVKGPYKIVTATLVSADGLHTLSVVQLRNADGKFIDQVIFGPDAMPPSTGHDYTGIAPADTDVSGRPDLFRFIPQERITTGGNTRVVPDTTKTFERTLSELFPGKVRPADSGTTSAEGLLQTLRLGSSKTVELWQLANGAIELRITGLAPVPISAPVDPGSVRLENGRFENTVHVMLGGSAYQIVDINTGKTLAPMPGFTLYETDRYTATIIPGHGKSYEVILWDKQTGAKMEKSLELAPYTKIYDFAYGEYHVRVASLVVGTTRSEIINSMVVVQVYDKEGHFLKQEILETTPGDKTNAYNVPVSFGPLGELHPDLLWMTPSLNEANRVYVKSLKELFPDISHPPSPPVLLDFLVLSNNASISPAVVDLRDSKNGGQEITVEVPGSGAARVFSVPFAGARKVGLAAGSRHVLEVSGQDERIFLDLDARQFFVETPKGHRLASDGKFVFTQKTSDATGSMFYIDDLASGMRRGTLDTTAFLEIGTSDEYHATVHNVSWPDRKKVMPFVLLYDQKGKQLSRKIVEPPRLAPDGSGLMAIAPMPNTQYAGVRLAPVSSANGSADVTLARDYYLKELFPEIPGLPNMGILQEQNMRLDDRDIVVQLIGTENGPTLQVSNQHDGKLLSGPFYLDDKPTNIAYALTEDTRYPGEILVTVDGLRSFMLDVRAGSEKDITPQIPVRVKGRDAIAYVMRRSTGVEVIVKDAQDEALAYPPIPLGIGNADSKLGVIYSRERPQRMFIRVDGVKGQYVNLDSGDVVIPMGNVEVRAGGFGAQSVYQKVQDDSTTPIFLYSGSSWLKSDTVMIPSFPTEFFPIKYQTYGDKKVILITLQLTSPERKNLEHFLAVVQLYDTQGNFLAQTVLGDNFLNASKGGVAIAGFQGGLISEIDVIHFERSSSGDIMYDTKSRISLPSLFPALYGEQPKTMPTAKILRQPAPQVAPATRLDVVPAGGLPSAPGVKVTSSNMGDQPPKVSGVTPMAKNSVLERLLKALEKNPSDAQAGKGVLEMAMDLNDEGVFLATLGRVEELRQKAMGNAGLLPLQKGLLQGLLPIYLQRKDWQSALDIQAALFVLAETRVEQRGGLETIARLFKSLPQANRAKAALAASLQVTPPSNAAEVQRSLEMLGLDAGKIYRLATDRRAMLSERFDGLMQEALLFEVFGAEENTAQLYLNALKMKPKDSDAAAGYARALIGIGLKEQFEGGDKKADLAFAQAAGVLHVSLLQRDPLHPGTLDALAELYQAVADEKMMARIAFVMLRRHPGHPATHKVLSSVWQAWFAMVNDPLPAEAKSALLSGFATILSNTEDTQRRSYAMQGIALVLARDGNKLDKKNADLARRIAKQADISDQTVQGFLNENLHLGEMSLGPDAEASVVNAIASRPSGEFLALTLDVYALVLGRPMENRAIAELIACGDDAFSQAKYQEAGRFYQEVLQRDPSRSDIAVNRAASLIAIAETGHWNSKALLAEADAMLTAAREKGPFLWDSKPLIAPKSALKDEGADALEKFAQAAHALAAAL